MCVCVCVRVCVCVYAYRIDVPCSRNLSTFDLETEVFLHVLNNCLEYVQVCVWVCVGGCVFPLYAHEERRQ